LLSLYRYDYGAFRNTHSGISASNIINSGTIRVLGQTNIWPTNQKNLTFSSIVTPVTNLASGMITTTNGALLGFHPSFIPKSLGTFLVNAESAMGIGSYASGGVYNDIVYFGLSAYRNEGTIDLRGGVFGVALLTNAVGATITGNGDIGYLVMSNMVSGSLLTTNLVRHFNPRPIANAGTIIANGTLNAGAITNLSGGLITGSGTINSYNVTNYYSGETLITDKIYTGARILNNAGASILASGGTLVLSNGLVNNTSAGTVGATSGGRLQIGDGTVTLTNNGPVSLTGGELVSGSLVGSGSIVMSGGVNALTIAGSTRVASGALLTASNTTASIAGVVTNLGTIRVHNSKLTFSNTVVSSGRYISDPSTNTFVADLTITPSGTLEGGLGDVFDFKKNLTINSTNIGQFNLVLSTVSFSGGGDHTNAITGLDFDNNPLFGESRGYTATNFAYGTLQLGASDNLYLVDGDGIGSNTNGLYIGVLDIGGDTNNVSLLHSPFNIYYRNGLAGNTYLGGLTYGLDGGGFLIPVPEPSSLLLALGALVIGLRCLRSQ
jgi:hypothetical protein